MGFLRGMTYKLIGKHLEFRVRLFNVLAMAGVTATFIAGLTFFITQSDVRILLIDWASSAAAFGIMYYAARTQKYVRCYYVTIFSIFLTLFPYLYFTTGGYDGGMPFFFVFAILFTAFMLEGKSAYFVLALELAIYIGCYVISFLRPGLVKGLSAGFGHFMHNLVDFTIVAVSLSAIALAHFGLYNAQQRELTAARKQTEEFARMKSELFADMSHEMRTPLTVMSGYAQYAVEQIRASGVNEQTLADLATIGGEAKRLAEMADGTLKILMSASGENKREAAAVDIGALTMRLAHLFGAIASRKGRKLTLDVKELPPVHGDTDALTQLLWNILQNAITHSEGDMFLSAQSDGETVQVAVSDNGKGIPPELLPQIFERGVSGREGGSGIGLSICREIARRHGGDIEIASEAGFGTTVAIKLPALREATVNG